MIHLYVKTSPKGLKYLGKTTKDPHIYIGSGKLWLKHLKKHKLQAVIAEFPSVREASQCVGVHKATVKNHCNAFKLGIIPKSKKVKSYWRYKSND